MPKMWVQQILEPSPLKWDLKWIFCYSETMFSSQGNLHYWGRLYPKPGKGGTFATPVPHPSVFPQSGQYWSLYRISSLHKHLPDNCQGLISLSEPPLISVWFSLSRILCNKFFYLVPGSAQSNQVFLSLNGWSCSDDIYSLLTLSPYFYIYLYLSIYIIIIVCFVFPWSLE